MLCSESTTNGFNGAGWTPTVINKPQKTADVDPFKVWKALSYHDKCKGYNDWIPTLAALHNAGLDDIAVAWSMTQTGFVSAEDVRQKLATFKDHPNPRTIASIFFEARKNGYRDEVETTGDDPYAAICYHEYKKKDFKKPYLVKRVLRQNQQMVIGAPTKCLKTLIATCLSYSLSTETLFLNHFPSQRQRVWIISGESGDETLQDSVNTHARLKGVEPDPDYLRISTLLPYFDQKETMEHMRKLLIEYGTQVWIIDPLYMCWGRTDTNNLASAGNALRAASDMCNQLGITLIVLAHTKKETEDYYNYLERKHLTGSGLLEWMRQWLLISRRSPYLDDNHHSLYFNIGNSSKNSSKYEVDIFEGTELNPDWKVKVQDSLSVKPVDTAEIEKEHILAMLESTGGLCQTHIKDETGFNHYKVKKLLKQLEDKKKIVKKGKSWEVYR